MISAFADYERSIITMRTKAGRIKKAKGGGYAGGNLTYGYDIKDGNLVLNKKELEVVKRIFGDYLSSESIKRLLLSSELRVFLPSRVANGGRLQLTRYLEIRCISGKRPTAELRQMDSKRL